MTPKEIAIAREIARSTATYLNELNQSENITYDVYETLIAFVERYEELLDEIVELENVNTNVLRAVLD